MGFIHLACMISSTLSKFVWQETAFSVALMVAIPQPFRRVLCIPAARDNNHFVAVCRPFFSPRLATRPNVDRRGCVSPSKRTVTAALEVLGLSQQPTFQTYHRVLNRCVWSPLAGSKVLLQALVAACAPRGRLILGLDDTLERCRGTQIGACGISRDPVRSSSSHLVKARGLRWLSLMLIVPLPWTGCA